ncbi:MAG: hypothetical protein ACHBN1_35915 [Heteroscytonema crispum UTEX LB 1556]
MVGGCWGALGRVSRRLATGEARSRCWLVGVGAPLVGFPEDWRLVKRDRVVSC